MQRDLLCDSRRIAARRRTAAESGNGALLFEQINDVNSTIAAPETGCAEVSVGQRAAIMPSAGFKLSPDLRHRNSHCVQHPGLRSVHATLEHHQGESP
jgi:hypothetical protein